MTVRGLLDFFENYYGEKYSGVFLGAMTEYLNGRSDEFLTAAAETVIKRFSRTFNKAPDVAVIEKNLEEILELAEDPFADRLFRAYPYLLTEAQIAANYEKARAEAEQCDLSGAFNKVIQGAI